MHKIFIVARHEYLRQTRKRSFLFTAFGLPVLFVTVIGLIIVVIASQDIRTVGYVDHAGFIQQSVAAQEEFEDLIAYPDLEHAQSALADGAIRSIIILPDGYPANATAAMDYISDDYDQDDLDTFAHLLQTQLATELPAKISTRMLEGWNFNIQSSDGMRSFDESTAFVVIMLPFVISFLFFMGVMLSSGYMLQAVTEEKENRTMEVMATSLSPLNLIGGKALGLLAVSLTQLLLWSLTGILLLIIGINFFDLPMIKIPWVYLGTVSLFFLPSFVLASGIMIAIGSTVTEMQQGQQIASMVSLLFSAPWLLSPLTFTTPNHIILQVMTFLPTTSLLTLSLRWPITFIPASHVVISLAILTISALLSVWLAGKIFRLGMLHYGQRMKLLSIVHDLRANYHANKLERGF